MMVAPVSSSTVEHQGGAATSPVAAPPTLIVEDANGTLYELVPHGWGCETPKGDPEWGKHRHKGDRDGWVSSSHMNREPRCDRAFTTYRLVVMEGES